MGLYMYSFCVPMPSRVETRDVLSALVETRKRFAATKYLFVVLKFETWRRCVVKIARATDKGKRNRSNERCRVADVLRAREQASALIVDLDMPGLFDDAHFDRLHSCK